MCVCVSRRTGGVLSCVEIRGKANIPHHVPSHLPFLTAGGSLKGTASCVCLPIISVLAEGKYTHLLEKLQSEKLHISEDRTSLKKT